VSVLSYTRHGMLIGSRIWSGLTCLPYRRRISYRDAQLDVAAAEDDDDDDGGDV